MLLREILASSYGNEFSLSAGLGLWLAGGSLGSFLCRHASGKQSRFFLWFTILENLFVLAGLLTVRIAPHFLAGPGQMISLGSFLLLSFLTLFLAGFWEGTRFVLAASVIGKGGPAYAAEGLGALLGGLSLTGLLYAGLNPFSLIAIAGLVNLAGCFSQEVSLRKLAAAAMVVWCGLGFSSPFLESFSRQQQWQPFRVIQAGYSGYGSVVLLENSGQKTLVRDGLVVFSSQPDIFSLTNTAFFPAAFHGRPEKALVIGNPGLVQSLKEVGVKQVLLLEPDHLVSQVLKENFLSPEDRNALLIQEPLRYLKNSPEQFDLVIIDRGLPLSLASLRFYSENFFQRVKQRLKPGGILTVVLPGSPDYLGKPLRQAHASVYRSCQKLFPASRIIFTEPFLYLFSREAATFSRDRKLPPEKDWRQQNFFDEVLDPVREEKFVTLLEEGSPGQTDTFSLRTLYFSLAWWLSSLSVRLGRFFQYLFDQFLQPGFPGWPLAVLLVAVGLLPVWRRRIRVVISFTNGLVSFAFEVLVLFLFQMEHGQLYTTLSLLVGLFMAGLGAGGLFSQRQSGNRWLLKVECCQILFYTLAAVFLAWMKLSSGLLSGILLCGAGFLLGWEFGLLTENPSETGKKEQLGAIYGADVSGALVGCFLVPLVLLPGLRFSGCLLLLPGLKVATFTNLRHQLF